jgi:hypothetical protein
MVRVREGIGRGWGMLRKLKIRGYPMSLVFHFFRHAALYRIKGFIFGHQSYTKTFFYSSDEGVSKSTVSISKTHMVEPKITDSSDFIFYSSSPIRNRNLFIMSPATVDTISGRVYDTEGKFLADSSAWSPPHAVFRWIAPLPKRFLSATKLSGTNKHKTFVPSQLYYHWLLEDLPSLIRVRSAFPDVQIYVSQAAHPYITEMFDFLGFDYTFAPAYLLAESLVFESRGPALLPQKIDVDTLNDLSWSVCKENSLGRKIYVSRKDAWRNPINFEMVEELARSHGFEVVSLTGMGPEDQIKLFQQATVIAGPHGAGLSNIVWAKRGTLKVIEIRFATQPPCFEVISSHLDFEYLKEESISSEDWRVDLNSLSNKMRTCDN